MKGIRAKNFKVRIFYHLQNLFWGFLLGGFMSCHPSQDANTSYDCSSNYYTSLVGTIMTVSM